MNTEPHILIVDDDKGIRDLIGQFLSQHNFQISLAPNGEAMRAALDKHSIDLIILDIMMPGEDGLFLCRQLRSSSSIPIIMLTAISEDIDRILGLEMGADDYLSKPFNPRELLARVKAILRRSKVGTEDQSSHAIYQFCGWTLDRTARRLTDPEGIEITLSGGEYTLLIAFLERPQQVLSRDYLLDLTKNRSAGPFDRAIDIQISRLRQKIEPDSKSPTFIKTIRGGGYVLAAAVTRC